jgi:hypothetical protein
MKKLLVVALVVGALALGLLVPRGSSAPALGERAVRFEYAELKYQQVFAPAAGQPGAAPAPGITKVKLVWTTADEEVEADGWDDLATKLKAPPAKKEGSDAMHQMRALNRMGADGWEVYEHLTPNGFQRTITWAFKRRLP